ncbi:MAG TPA: hypothetical protein VG873_09845 [Burkholderiales bacterium]|nr:hypothetical protein [Burkholderiales bacterium]
MRALVAVSLLLWAAFALAQGPGYGVVESVTRISRDAGEESASAGASRPAAKAKKPAGRYLVRVRMDDGSVQVRSVKRAEVRVGQRALITNAGDVVPE